jgi:hypothetical protein
LAPDGHDTSHNAPSEAWEGPGPSVSELVHLAYRVGPDALKVSPFDRHSVAVALERLADEQPADALAEMVEQIDLEWAAGAAAGRAINSETLRAFASWLTSEQAGHLDTVFEDAVLDDAVTLTGNLLELVEMRRLAIAAPR